MGLIEFNVVSRVEVEVWLPLLVVVEGEAGGAKRRVALPLPEQDLAMMLQLKVANHLLPKLTSRVWLQWF